MIESREELGNVSTVLLIKNDCESIKKIMLNFRNSIFSMQMIPYMALFCKSYQEYAEIELIDSEVDSEIYDLRNSIKLYSQRYGKSKKRFLTVNDEQDEEYKNMIKFGFLKNMNIHHNLGMYFTEDKKIIGNTQWLENLLKLHGLSEQEKQKKCFDLGYNLATVIGSVSKGLSNLSIEPQIELKGQLPVFLYEDINTNRNKFFNNNFEKDENLFLLHILSNINFVKYVLCPLFERDNLWIFRIKYISLYHAYMGILKIKNHIKNNSPEMNDFMNDTDSIIEDGNDIFVTKFRNCMMHYNLNTDSGFIISERNFSWNRLFFGLIEECFEGMSYEIYLKRLELLGNKIEIFLTKQFDFEHMHLKKL